MGCSEGSAGKSGNFCPMPSCSEAEDLVFPPGWSVTLPHPHPSGCPGQRCDVEGGNPSSVRAGPGGFLAPSVQLGGDLSSSQQSGLGASTLATLVRALAAPGLQSSLCLSLPPHLARLCHVPPSSCLLHPLGLPSLGGKKTYVGAISFVSSFLLLSHFPKCSAPAACLPPFLILRSLASGPPTLLKLLP